MDTFYVYGEIIHETGGQYWLRYIVTAEDAEEAARTAMHSWMGLRVQRIEVFPGEPDRFSPGAVRYYPVGVRREEK